MKKLLLICSFIFLGTTFLNAQTLTTGDIAIIGYHTDTPDGFTFIALSDIPPGEIVRFTEDGWCAAGSAWYITPVEGTIIWTAPAGGLSCGTIVYIAESTPDVFNITPGTGTAVIDPAGGVWNQSGGDQITAYQGAGHRPATPSFLTAVHGDYNAGDYNAGTTWNNGASCINTSSSGVPTGLTNGIDCVSLFPAPGPELDNARYTGSLSGTAAFIRSEIHSVGNWGVTSNAAIPIDPSAYAVPAVVCATPEPEIDILGNGVSIADGDVTPSLGDDTDFGTVSIGAMATNTFTIQNDGTADLTLSGGPTFVTLTGSSLFTVTSQPVGTISAAGSTTFMIQFDAACPNTSGTYTATVSLSSDDADESPYTFTIEADITGVDTDSDGALDLCDTDDDNDGIADGSDPDDSDFNVCGDSDLDGCDDCSVTNDGFGPLSDSDTANDGTDADCDGICDATDATDGASRTRGNMLTFDGDDFVSLGNISELDFGKASTLTIEAWINTSVNGDSHIISKYGGLFGAGWSFNHSASNGSLSFVMQGAFLDMFVAGPSGAPIVADGLWHHVAVTYDGSNAANGCTFYIDGVSFTGVTVGGLPGPITGTVTNTNSATIGAYEVGGPSDFWNGSLDEIRVWNDVRSQTEIRENRHLSISGGCDASNVGYWKFNEASGTTALDLSGNGNNGTHFGNPSLVSSEASVGKGISTTHNMVATATNYTSPSLSGGHDMELNFATTPPGGEVVVTYIQDLPVGGKPSGTLTNFRADHWIVNNYGPTNTGLDGTVHYNYEDGDITTVSLATYRLHKRGSNATGSWVQNNAFSTATSTVPGNNYIEFNAITDFSMFFPSSTISPLNFNCLLNNSITQNSGVLTANEVGGNYQWYECPDTLLTGEINQTYTPTTAGDYKVVITKDGCGVESACETVTVLGTENFKDSSKFSIYPNPSKGSFTLSYLGKETLRELTVFDITGKNVQTISLKDFNNSQAINLVGLAKGIYFAKIASDSAVITKKIIIE